MPDLFLTAFRESLQCSVLLALVLFYPAVWEKTLFRTSLLAGVSAAFFVGGIVGFSPSFTGNLLSNETWTFWRYVSELLIFYAGLLFAALSPSATKNREGGYLPFDVLPAALFCLGFFLFFFEARAVGFLAHDVGEMKDNLFGAFVSVLAGTATGFIPIVMLRKYLLKVPLENVFSAASLCITIGALQFAFGGVSEIEKGNILIPVQRNLGGFLDGWRRAVQSLLLISDHPFMDTAFSGLAEYIASDRTAMALTLLFVMGPPLLLLVRIFSSPDPLVGDLRGGAQKRYVVASFRKELVYQTLPVMTVIIILIILLHAVNLTLNPLYEPSPISVTEADHKGILKIPFSGDMSPHSSKEAGNSFEDKKLRKYVYFYGNEQIVFLAMLKPDGSLGVALDECEICRPPDWKSDAKGYSQRGEHLVCKYCMTPIAVSSLNKPGGCNPVPLPFTIEDNSILLRTEDVTDIYKKLQGLEKKGTHF